MEALKELKKRSDKELGRILEESREALRDMRFKVSQRQLKKVRDVRKTKRYIARILTILKERKPARNATHSVAGGSQENDQNK